MKILLVEDNHLFGEFIGAHIDGITAVETLNGAMDILNHEKFDLLLIDLGLPDSKGLDTLRAFAHIKTPKIVITVTEGCLLEAARQGFCDYVMKSDPHDMVKRIQFNIGKLMKKRVRFAPDVFRAIQSHLSSAGHDLISAH